MEKMLLIDGSEGEGGGQILRTSLALSLVTGRAFRMESIRARRKKPGLLRQHLTAVMAAAEISEAKVEGATIGSGELTFRPGTVQPGNYRFAVGTAGSATLVFQTILLPLVLAKEPSHVTVEGGTHNPLAPPFEFLAKTFLPLLSRMGAQVDATLLRHGFYPAGGGALEATITPARQLTPIELLQRTGEITHRQVRVLSANLPSHIATRELTILQERFSWPEESFSAITDVPSPGPGNAVVIEVGYPEVTEVFSGFGEKGIRAEAVIERVVREVRRYLTSSAPVGEHLADQLLIPLALAGGGAFRTTTVTPHTLTNKEVIQRFLPVAISIRSEADGTSVIEITQS